MIKKYFILIRFKYLKKVLVSKEKLFGQYFLNLLLCSIVFKSTMSFDTNFFMFKINTGRLLCIGFWLFLFQILIPPPNLIERIMTMNSENLGSMRCALDHYLLVLFDIVLCTYKEMQFWIYSFHMEKHENFTLELVMQKFLPSVLHNL